MTYLLDTDYVADYLVGRPDATALLDILSEQGSAISLITLGEIYEGIYFGRDPHKSEEGFQRFLRLVDVLPLNDTIARQFARIRGELRRTGRIIGDFDILIGATALHHNLILVIRNIKDYQRIHQLSLYKTT